MKLRVGAAAMCKAGKIGEAVRERLLKLLGPAGLRCSYYVKL